MIDNNSNESIGQRLKMLRLSRGMTAKQVAAELGVSPAYVSMLEKGKSNYNLSLLIKLMDVYGETLSDFLKSPEQEGKVRHLSDMQLFSEDNGKLTYHLIRSSDDPSAFRPYRFHLLPGGSTGISEPHAGVEYIFMIEGEGVLSLTYPDDGIASNYLLKETDSIYYPSSTFHAVKNESDSPCTFMLVFSPYVEKGGELQRDTYQHHIGTNNK